MGSQDTKVAFADPERLCASTTWRFHFDLGTTLVTDPAPVSSLHVGIPGGSYSQTDSLGPNLSLFGIQENAQAIALQRRVHSIVSDLRDGLNQS